MEPWDPTPRWLRWTQHPNAIAATVLLFLLFVIVSPLGSVVHRTRCHRGLYLTFYEQDSELVACSFRDCDCPEDKMILHDNPIARARVTRVNSTSGFGFDSIRHRGTDVYVHYNATDLDNTEIEERALDYALESSYAPYLVGFRPGEPIRTSVVWSGVFLNVLLVLLPVHIIYGLTTHTRRKARLDRLNQGRCPVCRYAIDGLPAARCPECGTDLPNPEHAPTE